MNYLSGNIRHLRRIRGLSQAELAKNFGKKQNTIGNWENGISEPSIKELVTLSQVFMIDMSSLVNRNLEHVIESIPEPTALESIKPATSLSEEAKELEGFWLALRELRQIQEKLDKLLNSTNHPGK
jgi:transcriptional regulator with XRE-family HTH domain